MTKVARLNDAHAVRSFAEADMPIAAAFEAVAHEDRKRLSAALDLLVDFYNRQKNECDPSWTRFQCRVYDLLRFSGRVK